MKAIIALSAIAVGATFAGEKTPIFEKDPIMPPPPSLLSWFAGGTVGYLTDNEEEMYTLHVGVDFPDSGSMFSQSLYLEVGYTELSECFGQGGDNGETTVAAISDNFTRVCADIEIIPVTLNYKLEKPISNSLNWYLGAGAGVAFIDATLTASGPGGSESASDSDTVPYAQAFTGLLYNVNPSWELYGGVRYIYFDDPSFSTGAGTAEWSDLESGFGFSNSDVLVELGGRYNF